MKKLFGLLLIFGLLYMFKCDGADILGIQQRFNDSSHYDYYYSCNICGRVLTWVVNGEEVLKHVREKITVGGIEYKESQINSSSLKYSSLILSARPDDNRMCMDAIFVVTQNSSDLRPQVECKNDSVSHFIQYREIQNKLIDGNDSSVVLRTSANSYPDVVSPGNGCSTQIVVCRTKDTLLRWSNGTFNAPFNGASNAGSTQFQQHPSDPTITLWNSVVLEKIGQFITSAIFWTDYISAGSYHLSCHSHTGAVSTMVNTLPITAPTISIPVSSVASQSKAAVGSVTTSFVSSSESMSHSLTFMMCALVLSMCFTKNLTDTQEIL